MTELPKIALTPAIADDANLILGWKCGLNEYESAIGQCFSDVDFTACVGCDAQRACSVYKARRLGVEDQVRDIIGTGDCSPVPPQAVQVIQDAQLGQEIQVIVNAQPTRENLCAPATEPVNEVVTSTPLPDVAPLPPGVIPGVVPVPVTPDDLSTMDRESLVERALSLGFTKEDLHRKRVPALREMIRCAAKDTRPVEAAMNPTIERALEEAGEPAGPDSFGGTDFPDNIDVCKFVEDANTAAVVDKVGEEIMQDFRAAQVALDALDACVPSPVSVLPQVREFGGHCCEPSYFAGHPSRILEELVKWLTSRSLPPSVLVRVEILGEVE